MLSKGNEALEHTITSQTHQATMQKQISASSSQNQKVEIVNSSGAFDAAVVILQETNKIYEI